MKLIGLASGNLRHRPARTSLTVFAIALGIAAVVALTGIAWGFEANWQQANDVRGTDLIVTRIASENAMPSPFLATSLVPTLQAYPHVRQVVGLLSEMLSVGDDAPPVFVFGWAHGSYLWAHLRLVDGRWPATDTETVVVLGSLASELLHKKTGDALEIEGREFRVAGTFESAAVVENGAVLMTLTQMQGGFKSQAQQF
jgi:putative ABC transport system permease protein